MSQMSRFTPAYDRAGEAAKQYKFALDWHQFLTDKVGIKILLASAAGPDASHGTRLDMLRAKLTETMKKVGGSTTEGDMLLEMAGIKAASVLSGGQADALATLKMLRHLYYQCDSRFTNGSLMRSAAAASTWPARS